MTQLFDDRPTPRRPAIPLLVELCAGTAALSLRLERAGARPPVSRMGAKTGYADCILALAGLEPGDKAGHYLWCEPDDGVRLLLHAYRDADLAREAARIIRSWADEEPRALWERLRAEGPARCPGVDAREVARCLQIIASNELINLDSRTWQNTGKGGSTFGGDIGYGADRMLRKLEAAPTLPATIHDDATTLDPREVARNVVVNAWSFRVGEPSSGFNRSEAIGHPASCKYPRDCERIAGDAVDCPALPATIHDDATTLDPREVARWAFVQRVTGRGASWGANCDLNGNGGCNPATGERHPFNLRKNTIKLRANGTLPATIHDDATTAPIPDPLPAGTLVFIDPPYVGTTGYAHDLDRPAVVRLAQQWAAAGARVMISEAVPIEALVSCGWHAVEISAMRVGQKRTFSKQQREWVTTSFQPDRRAVRACELAAERAERAAAVMAGGEQRDLFGGAA